MTTKNGQTKRILEYLLLHPNEDISAARLSEIGSGIYGGWCSSVTRRISDIRALGYNLVKSRDETKNGIRHTWYKLVV